MKYYKAFNHNMTCNGKQYQENQVFEENGTEICSGGVMHFCENPFDVLNYYPLIDDNGNFSEFAEIEPLSNVLKKDEKSASNKIKIGLKLGFNGFIKACIDFALEKTSGIDMGNSAQIGSSGKSAQIGSSGNSAQIGSSGDYAQIGSSGNSAQIGSSGDSAKIGSSGKSAQIGSSGYSAKIGSSGKSAQIGSSGYYAKIGSSGYYAQIGSSGDYAQIGSSGNSAQIGSSGDYAQIGSSGNSAQIGSSGYYAQIGSSGNYAQIGSSGNSAQIGSSGYSAKITSSGKHSVIMCAGINSIAKAKIGSFITLSEWEYDNYEKTYIPINVVTKKVDGIEIKEDKFYRLEKGKFVEMED